MSGEFAVPTWLAALVLVGLVALLAGVVALLVAVRRARRHTDAVLADAVARTDELRGRLTDLEARLSAEEAAATGAVPANEADPEYLITELGTPAEPAPTLPPQAFADQVARESAIRAGALVAGLRRALAPETRNRIRFEMRREVKRSRKQRRADVKQAVREWEARQRERVNA